MRVVLEPIENFKASIAKCVLIDAIDSMDLSIFTAIKCAYLLYMAFEDYVLRGNVSPSCARE